MVFESLQLVFIVFHSKYSFYPCAVSIRNCIEMANFFLLTDNFLKEKDLYLQNNSFLLTVYFRKIDFSKVYSSSYIKES